MSEKNARRLIIAGAGLLLLSLLLMTAPAIADSLGGFVMPMDDDVIRYTAPDTRDPVALAQQRIDKGEAKLVFDKKHGYLESVLRLLKVPISSQVLVFSKTSFQLTKISPGAPRALYFNDDVYVGWVQDGDFVEVGSVDPEKGGIFYVLPQKASASPKFLRRDDCLQCHASPHTLGVPGFFMRSVYPAADGTPLLQAGSFVTDDRSPMKERWGGWFVSGAYAKQAHMGNALARDASRPEQLESIAAGVSSGAGVTDLKKLVDTGPYLAPHSDIVALMVLEHQARLHDLITRVSYETRIAENERQVLQKQYGETGESESYKRRITRPVEALLAAMLFTEESPLADRVTGASGFQAEFEQRGPQDGQGRSLRQFDLQHRLFRYPLSFLIYSPAFDGLPPFVKERFYSRLWEVLTGKDQSPAFAALAAADRHAILEILAATKPGLPDYWKAARPAATLPAIEGAAGRPFERTFPALAGTIKGVTPTTNQ